MIMVNTVSVSDTIKDKIYHLTKALNQTKKIIDILQKETDNLKHSLRVMNDHFESQKCVKV